MEILILVGSLGLFTLIIVWAVKHTKKTNQRKNEMYSQFALKRGLEHTTSKYFMAQLHNVEGTIDGFNVQIFEKMEGSSKSKQVMTRIIFSNPPFDFDFKIGKEHIFSKTGKMLGLKDVEFDNPEFDKKFLMKSKDETKFKSLMNHNMQHELAAIEKDLKAAIRHSHGTLTYVNYGPLVKEEQFQSFERVLDYMFRLMKEKYY